MPTYISLVTWTDAGRKSIRDTVHRAEVAANVAEKLGAHFKDLYWVNGPYDICLTLEAPDDQTATAVAYAIEEAGNVRTTTMRAYDRSETQTILDRLP